METIKWEGHYAVTMCSHIESNVYAQDELKMIRNLLNLYGKVHTMKDLATEVANYINATVLTELPESIHDKFVTVVPCTPPSKG